MDPSRPQTDSPVQKVASYTCPVERSVPSTPIIATGSSQSGYNASQVDDLTRSDPRLSPLSSPTAYKPTKRKRLAKACDACHRSKRRCDGTAPCANCEFAGKPCTYTDQTGRAVAPPRSRASDLRRPGLIDGWPYPVRDAPSGELHYGPLRGVDPLPTTSDASPSPLDPTLTRDLVNLFFSHCHPVTFIFHRPTVLHDLARSQIPSYLLLSLLAVAAPYSLHRSRLSTPSWHAGEDFASQAARILFSDEQQQQQRQQQHASGLSGVPNRLCVKPCVEVAQALCLLQFHENVVRRPGKTDRFLVLAQETINALDLVNLDLAPPSTMTYAGYVQNETVRRIFWYIYHIELLSAALTQGGLPTLPEGLSQLRLPVEDALFEMPRVENRPGVDPSYDYLPLPTERKVCRSEFGNLIRVTRIYAEVVNATDQTLRTWSQGQASIAEIRSSASLEVDLRKWLDLPDHLRFTEDNLQAYVGQLGGGAGMAAWAFLFMHALAESTVLGLHELASLDPEKGSKLPSTREQKALDNLTMIMGAMDPRARSNLMMATPLVTVGKHAPPQHPHIAMWFEEYQRMWGISYEDLMNVQFRSAWVVSSSTVKEHALGGEFIHTTQNIDFSAQFAESTFLPRRVSSSEASSSSHSRGAGFMEFGVRGEGSSSRSQTASIYEPSSRAGDNMFSLTQLAEGGMSNERLGTLATTAVVDGVSLPGPSGSTSTHDTIRPYPRHSRMSREMLPAIVTSGLSTHGMERTLYPDPTTNANGQRGKSEESERHPVAESPTVAISGSAVPANRVQLRGLDGSVRSQPVILTDPVQQPLSQFQSRAATLPVAPYGRQAVEAEIGENPSLGWLEEGS